MYDEEEKGRGNGEVDWVRVEDTTNGRLRILETLGIFLKDEQLTG